MWQRQGRQRARGPLWLLLSIMLWVSSAPAQATGNLAAGIELFENGQLAAARQFFESFVIEYPADAAGPFYLGRIVYEEEQYDRAVEWFEKAVAGAERKSEYHLWLGRSYGQKAKQANVVQQPLLAKKVKGHFETAVMLDPNNIEARYALMEYYSTAPVLLGGSKEKAREQAEEIRKRDVSKSQTRR